MGMVEDSHLSSFNQGIAQISATGFGNAPGTGGLTRIVNASAQTGIAHQVLCGGETLDCVNG